MEGKTKYRLENKAIVIITFCAGAADALTFIPFVGDAIGPIFWIGASIYFWKAGLGFGNAKRLATTALSTVAELIPIVQELPTILVGTVAIIMMSRTEDKLGISKNSTNKTGITAPRNQRWPVNRRAGIRPPNKLQNKEASDEELPLSA